MTGIVPNGGLHPGRNRHRHPHRRRLAVLAAVPDAGDDHFSCVHAHAHPQVNLSVLSQLAGVTAERLLHGQRREDSALRVVLVGRGRAEERHQAIAPELIHFAAKTIDLRLENVEEAIHQLHPGFGAHLFKERRGAGEIGEDHRHDPPLAL